MNIILFAFTVISSIYLTTAGDPDTFPKHVHISLNNDPQSMVISWTIFAPLSANVAAFVNFGKTFDTLTQKQQATYSSFKTKKTKRYIFKAVLTNLEYDTRYFYSVGSTEGISQVFSFKTFPSGSDYPVKICIFGDLGVVNGVSLSPLIAAGQRGDFDMIIHLGDLAYDLRTDDGDVGDTFMESLQPLIATKPYMVIAGNHEFEKDQISFENYESRFFMPEDGDGHNQYYSVQVSSIQFLGISSELYAYFTHFGTEPVEDQHKFLEKKMQSVDRSVHPWVIAYHHRPIYCSGKKSDDCSDFESGVLKDGFIGMPGLEKFYYDNSVDMVFTGHQHNYERYFPVYDRKVFKSSPNPYHNAKATTYVISGNAGCHSSGAAFGKISPFSAIQSQDYGYSILHVINKTTLYMEQISSDPKASASPVIDSLTLTKDPGFNFGSAEVNENDYTYYPKTNFEVPPMITNSCYSRDLRCRQMLSGDKSKVTFKKYFVGDEQENEQNGSDL
uniref:Purple acid phosphatase n=1 Tax=Rhabditophanes sp. KR3021 TaxID=114890 RepID=A0AC35TM98_9BILA